MLNRFLSSLAAASSLGFAATPLLMLIMAASMGAGISKFYFLTLPIGWTTGAFFGWKHGSEWLFGKAANAICLVVTLISIFVQIKIIPQLIPGMR